MLRRTGAGVLRLGAVEGSVTGVDGGFGLCGAGDVTSGTLALASGRVVVSELERGKSVRDCKGGVMGREEECVVGLAMTGIFRGVKVICSTCLR